MPVLQFRDVETIFKAYLYRVYHGGNELYKRFFIRLKTLGKPSTSEAQFHCTQNFKKFQGHLIIAITQPKDMHY